MKAINLTERVYVVQDERKLPVEEQTKFTIRPLEYADYVQIQDNMARAHGGLGDLSLHVGTQERIALMRGVARIDNFKGDDQREIPWPSVEADRMHVLSMIPPKYRSELARVIMAEAAIDETQAGESDSRPESPGAGAAIAPVPNGATAS